MVNLPRMSARLIIFYILIFLTGCFSKRTENREGLIASKALKEDVSILQKTLEEAHPGLYWYSNKTLIDSLFDGARAVTSQDMTRLEFFKVMLPVIAGIKCSHTNIRLPGNVNGEMALRYTNLLPFEFYFHNEKVFIRRSFNGANHQGKEVLSINEMPINQILSRLLNSIPADGYNQTFKYNILSRGLMTEGYAMHFGDTAVYIMDTKDTNGKLQTIQVNAASPQQVRAAIPNPLPILSLDFRDGIAVLSINSFVINNRSFTDSITSIFQTLKEKNVRKLIIDLRKNGGGNNENVSALFSFIARAPFRHLRQAEMIGKRLTYSAHISNARSIDNYSRDHKRDDRYIVNDSYVGTRLSHPRDSLVFAGDVVVLASGNTVSAASEFVAIFHYQQRGKIVGEETGGCYYGSTGGNYLQLRLPNSGLEVTIPTIRIFTAVEEVFNHQPKGRGTFPDYNIIPRIEDIINGKDVQMEKAVEILR